MQDAAAKHEKKKRIKKTSGRRQLQCMVVRMPGCLLRLCVSVFAFQRYLIVDLHVLLFLTVEKISFIAWPEIFSVDSWLDANTSAHSLNGR